MAVHVSIHDVSPAFSAEVEAALDACRRAQIRPALLVVPNHHGRAPLDAHPDFAARIRDLQADGHEVFLHGYFHRAGLTDDGAPRERPRGGRLARYFRQSVVSDGEAEFADVSPDEALARLVRGEKMLERAGLRIDGFVPPAWSMPAWGRQILADRGYRYTEDHLRIYDPKSRTRRTSIVLNFASRTPSRLVSSALFARIARPAASVFPARLAIHPADMRFALLRREIDRLLAWAKGDLAPHASDLFSAG